MSTNIVEIMSVPEGWKLVYPPGAFKVTTDHSPLGWAGPLVFPLQEDAILYRDWYNAGATAPRPAVTSLFQPYRHVRTRDYAVVRIKGGAAMVSQGKYSSLSLAEVAAAERNAEVMRSMRAAMQAVVAPKAEEAEVEEAEGIGPGGWVVSRAIPENSTQADRWVVHYTSFQDPGSTYPLTFEGIPMGGFRRYSAALRVIKELHAQGITGAPKSMRAFDWSQVPDSPKDCGGPAVVVDPAGEPTLDPAQAPYTSYDQHLSHLEASGVPEFQVVPDTAEWPLNYPVVSLRAAEAAVDYERERARLLLTHERSRVQTQLDRLQKAAEAVLKDIREGGQ